MARPLRIQYSGAIYHVMSRGDRRQDIFRQPEELNEMTGAGGASLSDDWRASGETSWRQAVR